MPELPEVEQVRISLEPYVLEQKIEDVRILLPRMIVHPSPEGFRKGLRDAVVTAVLRRGNICPSCSKAVKGLWCICG